MIAKTDIFEKPLPPPNINFKEYEEVGRPVEKTTLEDEYEETTSESEELKEIIKTSKKLKEPKIPEDFKIIKRPTNPEITAGGLMNGAGAGLLGAIIAGFTPKFIIDNRKFVNFKTWDWNFSPYHVLFSQKVDNYRDVETDLIVGSPSCAKFSRMGKREYEGLPLEAALPEVFEYVAFLKEIMARRPRFFILENVVNVRSYLWFEELLESKGFELKAEKFDTGVVFVDYNIQEEVLDTTSFGLGQHRKRLYIIGSLKEYNFDYKTPKKTNPKSAQDCIGYLESSSTFFKYINHEPIENDEDRIKQFKELKPGETVYGTVVNKRIQPDYPTPTITGGATKLVHYSEPRLLTPRECAVLQGFSDDFVFFGGIIQQYDQIGKGLSPTIITDISKQIIKALEVKGQIAIPKEFKPKKRWIPRISIKIERKNY